MPTFKTIMHSSILYDDVYNPNCVNKGEGKVLGMLVVGGVKTLAEYSKTLIV